MEAVSAAFVQLVAIISTVLAVVLLGVVVAGADREWLVFGALLAGHVGLGAWQLQRGRPDPLVHSAALGAAVAWLVFFASTTSVVVPLGTAAVLGIASVFGSGRRLAAYLGFVAIIWLVELAEFSWHISAYGLPASHHVDEAIGLGLQLGLFLVTATIVRRVTRSLTATDSLY
ncbi:MAG: hypothetical protein GY773_34145, partial [Actinomycetia bacterium]|nr:hypothetical protein [Actinomycetes bacterium]